MDFQQLLLLILQKLQGERSSTAPFYLLRGKKSGQTIQDVTYFQLHALFSIFPQLTKEEYDQEILALVTNGYIEILNSSAFLTEKGTAHIHSLRTPQFNGWLYRGNEQTFWSRLELVVQTLSYFQANVPRFIPNQKNQSIHQFVREFLVERDFRNTALSIKINKQLTELLKQDDLDDIHRDLFVYRLSGFKSSGWTWEQLAEKYEKRILDVKLLFIESVHIALSHINEINYPDLYLLTKDIEVMTPLTESANKSYNLLMKGYSIEDVAKMRSLRTNTIEDHIIEIVSADPSFPISAFVSNEQVEQVANLSKKLQTKKLKEYRAHLPELSYFQIRIALSRGVEANG